MHGRITESGDGDLTLVRTVTSPSLAHVIDFATPIYVVHSTLDDRLHSTLTSAP